MSNIFGDFRRLVVAALDDLVTQGALPAGLDFARVAVEPPRDPAHGDLSTNAAMVLAGAGQTEPDGSRRADRRGTVRASSCVSGDYRGPGFTVGVGASPVLSTSGSIRRVWHAQLRADLARRHRLRRLGRSVAAKSVNVEFVSANPTGPDACRARPRRGGRRRAGGAAGQGRLRGPAASITSTMPAPRSMCSRARSICATARLLGERIGAIPEGFYPGDYLVDDRPRACRARRAQSGSTGPRPNGWRRSASLPSAR